MSVTVATWHQRAREPRFRTRALIGGAFCAAGGFKQSGIGRDLSFHALGNFTAL
jgi:hypothetical protein